MRNLNVQHYYNRFDPAKNHEMLLARDGFRIQGAETNDMQEMFIHRLKSVADALLADGDIIQGGQVVVSAQSGEAQAQESVVYINGGMRRVPAAEFTIPLQGQVSIGVYLTETVVSELEDPTLRNPAIGTRGEGEPGAWRLRVDAQWGYHGDGQDGAYYPVHVVDDGVLRVKEAPPNLDSFNQGIARYDRDHTGGGTYIASGLVLRAAETGGAGTQIYTLSEGRARVWGYAIDIPTSRRLSYGAAPDLREIETEIHTADGSPSQRIDVAHAPIHSITMLRVTLQKSVSVVHGAYTGAADALPDAAVVDILECRQGETVYVKNTDYKKTGDTVDWNLPGNEPAPGSTYSVTYTYMATVAPVDQDFDGFSIEGAVAGSSILLSYNQAVPRIDRLCLTQDGAFTWQRGVAAEINARPPAVPDSVLAIASVHQTWRDAVRIENDGIRIVTFDALATMSENISALYQEVARQRLEADISTREAGARVGIFVDPLLSDEMRDQGIPQTGAIVDQWLTLPISADIERLANPLDAPVVQQYAPQIILSQTLRTGEMQVNPYQAFDPLPARVTLVPSTDQWTDVQTTWTSSITALWSGSEIVSSTTTAIEHLRQIEVSFSIQGFGAGETLQQVTFDGLPVPFTPSPLVADANGGLAGSFIIPSGVPAGAKEVIFKGGSGDSVGKAAFVGQGNLTVQVARTVTLAPPRDPLAQTFMLDAPAQICGVDLWFTDKGGDVRVQLREVQNGVPTRVVLAEAVVAKAAIVVSGGGHTRVLFPAPVQMMADVEYAFVVLCDDAVTAVAVAELGKFDAAAQKWVAAQPYTVGVLLSSSNALSWTVHQTMDMTFRLLAADFIAGAYTVEMGEAPLTGATDLMLLALEEAPTSQTRATYELELPGGETMTLAPRQHVRLPAPVSGSVTVRGKLAAVKSASPVLWPGPQLLVGTVAAGADYYARSISAIAANKAVLIYDARIPSGATVTPEIQIDGGVWMSLAQVEAVPQGNGIVEYRFEHALVDADLAKVRLTLTGTAAARPSVGLIRFMAIK